MGYVLTVAITIFITCVTIVTLDDNSVIDSDDFIHFLIAGSILAIIGCGCFEFGYYLRGIK